MENFKNGKERNLKYLRNIVLSVFTTFMINKTQGQTNQLQRPVSAPKTPIEINFEEDPTQEADSLFDYKEYDKNPDTGLSEQELIEQMLREEIEKLTKNGVILTEQEIEAIRLKISEQIKNPIL